MVAVQPVGPYVPLGPRQAFRKIWGHTRPAPLAGFPKHRKVCIVGFSNTRGEAPYADPDMEIWGLNDIFEVIPRVDRLFQVHQRTEVETHTTRTEGKPHPERLKELKCPIIMGEAWPEIPNSVAIPIKRIIAATGGEIADYYTNTVSYMIALAIAEEFQEIHVYGVDMAVGSEYESQRPSCELFLGIAIGRGIKLVIPPTSDLLKTRFRYGLQDREILAFDLKCDAMLAILKGRREAAEVAEGKLSETCLKYQGAEQAIRETCGGIIEGLAPAVVLPRFPCSDEAKAALTGVLAALQEQFGKKVAEVLAGVGTRFAEAAAEREKARMLKHMNAGAEQAVKEMGKTWRECT
jgi:hypothetical protein